MRNINTLDELENEISYLKNLRQQELLSLKAQCHFAVDSLKPTNIVKSALHNVLTAPDLKSTALKASIGFGTAALSKLLYGSQMTNPVKLALTQVVKFGIGYFNKRKEGAATAV
jgi:hypothetical protein